VLSAEGELAMTKRAKDETVFTLFAVLSFLLIGTIIVPGVVSAPRAPIEAASFATSR
jgi:hypothetical protein